MEIAYYFFGLLTGVSVTAFFIGKELYKYYKKYNVQQKQLNKILNLYDKIKKIKNVDSIESHKLNAGL